MEYWNIKHAYSTNQYTLGGEFMEFNTERNSVLLSLLLVLAYKLDKIILASTEAYKAIKKANRRK